MLKSKKDLKYYLKCEKQLYKSSSKKDRFLDSVTCMPNRTIGKYVRLLRITEFFYNNRSNKFYSLCYLLVRRRKNLLGMKIGIEIFENSFLEGLLIYHAGNIVINGKSRIGRNCLLHGDNCIGNNGKSSGAPVIGDNVDIGVGAKIIGNISIANNIKIGAGAVVIDSFEEEGITICGVPARKVK